MKNKHVGMLIIGIAVLIGFIIYSFNTAMTDIVNTSCSHGPSCTMWQSIDFQTQISIGILAFVILVGLYLIFFGKDEILKEIHHEIKEVHVKEKIEPKKIDKEHYEDILAKLETDEKNIVEKMIEAQGTLFQSDLVEKTGYTKVKVTRILDKLEGRGIIERKRRGMTNVVILKR